MPALCIYSRDLSGIYLICTNQRTKYCTLDNTSYPRISVSCVLVSDPVLRFNRQRLILNIERFKAVPLLLLNL